MSDTPTRPAHGPEGSARDASSEAGNSRRLEARLHATRSALDRTRAALRDARQRLERHEGCAEPEGGGSFQRVAETFGEVFWIRDADGAFRYVSPAFEPIWGRPRADLRAAGDAWLASLHPEDRPRLREALRRQAKGDAFDLEYRILRPDGEQRWIRDRGYPQRGPGTRAAGLATDVTPQKLHEERLLGTARRLRALAYEDPLTGVANRRGLEFVMERRARQGRPQLAVLVDCDDFKLVNDRHGHAAGDEVLRAVADRLRAALRPGDTLARIGGDEFLALLDRTPEDEGLHVAERLRRAVRARPVLVVGARYVPTVSIGLARVEPGDRALEAVLVRLHRGLARSKRGGKDRVAESGEEGLPVRRAQDALPGGALRVVAQAICDLATGELAGHELLTRGPAGPWSSPERVFAAARERGLLTSVDARCVVRGLAATPADAAALPTGARLHVNVYPSTLLELAPERVAELLAGRPEGRECTVELVESQLVDVAERLGERVRLLRELGVGVAVDDVGCGHSSLEALVELEPDVAKLDRRLVRGCDVDADRRRRLARTLAVVRSVGALPVAEGIEEAGELAVVRDLGVTLGQGYLLGRPRAVLAG